MKTDRLEKWSRSADRLLQGSAVALHHRNKKNTVCEYRHHHHHHHHRRRRRRRRRHHRRRHHCYGMRIGNRTKLLSVTIFCDLEQPLTQILSS